MTTYPDFMTGVYSWVCAVTQIDAQHVFRANQSNPDLQSTDSWATYKIISMYQRDYPLEKKVVVGVENEETDYVRIFPGTTTVSVNLYHENGAQLLDGLFASRFERATRALLKSAGAVLIDRSNVRNIPLLSDTGWKHRYQADFTFNTFLQRIERDYIADIFELTGKIENDEQQIYVDRNG